MSKLFLTNDELDEMADEMSLLDNFPYSTDVKGGTFFFSSQEEQETWEKQQ